MSIKNLNKEEILTQIKYLEKNISNGPSAYICSKLNRLESLRASLR